MEHYDIFISYRRDGGFETAKHLNDLLVHDGYTVSFDIDTLREGDFDETLLKRIDQCVDFILVVDKHTFDRTLDPEIDPKKDWLRTELAYALKLKKNIIPVLLSGANFPSNLPDDLKEIHRYNGLYHNSEYVDAFYEKMKGFLLSQPSNNMKVKYDIFISYRRVDGIDYARILQKALQLRGYKVFLDYEGLEDGTYGESIRTAIKNSSVFMMVLSPLYLDRCKYEDDWVRQEIMLAIQQKKYIIPINPNNSFGGFPDGIPDDIKWVIVSYQFAEVDFGEFFEDSIDKIVNTRVLNKTRKKVTKTHDIFLAYPRKDIEAGERLSKKIQSNGLSVWRDVEGIYAGEMFVDIIENAISNSKVFIALYSKWALESTWFNHELALAQEDGIPIIKVLTDTPEGLSGTRRMSFGSMLEMGSNRFEEKLLSGILNNGCKPDTKKMFARGKEMYDRVQINNNLGDEGTAFRMFMRAAELGDYNALGYIEREKWNINLSNAVAQYVPISTDFVKNIREELYHRGEIVAEDETVSDNTQRGKGMEMAAFKMMKRAIDLGYEGESPSKYCWYYLTDKEFEECLYMLGASSRIQREGSNSKDNQIFISYKRNDKDLVFPIVERIEESTGAKCWIDLDGIESDAQFANVIIKAINKAQIFLFMYSHSHTVIEDYDTDWTVKEINFAQKKKKRIVFINMDSSPLTDWFELMFGTKQQIDASSKVLMEKLCKDMTKWLK